MGKTTIKSNSVVLLSSDLALYATGVLNSSIKNYDLLVVEMEISGQSNYSSCITIPVSSIAFNKTYSCSYTVYSDGAWFNNGVEFVFTDNTHIRFAGAFANKWNAPKISQVYGIRNK